VLTQQNPRSESGSPQSILAALLADFSWEDVADPLPSNLFVHLLSVFGIDAASARVALDRVCKKGLLDRHPSGRLVRYRLSAAAGQRRTTRIGRLLRFAGDLQPWDGTWTLLITSVPESRKELRAKLRAQMLALAFARQYDAVWVKPNRTSLAEAINVLEELGIEQGTVFSATYEQRRGLPGDPLDAFDLTSAEEGYRAFIREFGELAAPGRSRLSELDCLVLRIRLIDAWREAIRQDPLLPRELMREDSCRDTAQSVFLTAYDALGPGAEAALRDVGAAIGLPDLPLHHFRSRQLAAPPGK
jgi:phenylacetic acid degradation operon negative regulatory protein